MSRSSRSVAAPEVDDLWKLATTQREETEAIRPNKVGNETFTLFVGQKQAGKSSLITAFHNPAKDDAPKPTVALEYLFARRSATTPNQPKDVAHIWELGGGSQLSALVSVPLTPRTINRAVVTVVVDLSQPQNLAHALGLWLNLLRARCDECVNALKQSDPSAAEALLAAASARASGNNASNSSGSGSTTEHPDKHLVKPFPVPLLIIGSKLDTLKDRDSQDKKLVCCLLRFVAHAHGASLLTVGTKDKVSQGNLRSTLTGLLLPSSSGTSSSKAARKEMSYDKPLVVTPGSDTFDDIFKASSLPKGVDSAGFVGKRGVSEDWVKKWGRPLEEAFGPAKPSPEDLLLDASSSDGQPFVEGDGEEKGAEEQSSPADLYREPLVDEARALRDAALAQYKKEADRKARAELAAQRSTKTTSSKASSSAAAAAKPRSSRSADAKAVESK